MMVEYAPGQFGTLICTGSDTLRVETCATCGGPMRGSGRAARFGDGKLVHFMADRDRPGYVLDCVTSDFFRTSHA